MSKTICGLCGDYILGDLAVEYIPSKTKFHPNGNIDVPDDLMRKMEISMGAEVSSSTCAITYKIKIKPKTNTYRFDYRLIRI
jgi:hypothetical protein